MNNLKAIMKEKISVPVGPGKPGLLKKKMPFGNPSDAVKPASNLMKRLTGK